ncbi:MAG: SusD/RagB family nutrient-binding outer membrane lipoprotein [Saprospiraceae bacterium]|nr:SusD/RagB family nutrient-binding outer membrane lipoprotein [Saprospiraceae bacterium]
MKFLKLLLIIPIFFTACTDFGDINIDPDVSPGADPKQVITSAQGYLGWVMEGTITDDLALWNQYWTQGPGVALGDNERYRAEPGNYNNIWTRSYANALTDLEYVINNGTTAQKGISKVMKAYIFQVLVDLFGDIPYTEALQGETNFSPGYDDGKSIYADLLKTLDESLADLNGVRGESGIGSEDLIYQGDLSKWIKFANSLKLRMLMRQSITGDKAAIGAAVKSLIAQNNFISDEADIAKINFAGTSGSENPMYANLEQSLSLFYCISNTTLKALTDDPRLDVLFSKAPNTGTYVGIDQGNIEKVPFALGKRDFSYATSLGYAKDSPAYLMTNWETWFLRAEAALVFGTADNTVESFETAVNANMAFLGAEPGDYIVNLGYGALDAQAKFNLLAVEKWKSFNGTQEIEAWAETRRMDTPTNKIFTSPTTGIFKKPTSSSLPEGVYPTALLYPESERSFNSKAAPQRELTGKVFWDN